MSIVPLDGGLRFTQAQPRPISELRLRSQTLRRLFGLEPKPTVWEKENGRPIYDRLPMAKERYKKIPEDTNYGKVYISETQNVAFGPGSLKVEQINNTTFFINSGEISWPEGITSHPELRLDVGPLGLQASRWFLGYELIVNSEKSLLNYYIEDQSLENYDGWTISSVTENCGYESEYAMWNEENKFFRPAGDPLIINFSVNANFSRIIVPVAGIFEIDNTSITINTTAGPFPASYFDEELSALVWEISSNEFFTEISFNFGANITSVSGILFTGTYQINLRKESLLESSNLVIYNFDDPDVQTSFLTFLSYFETNSRGEITIFNDIRNITNIKNEPVASWLTQEQDDTLIYLYEQYKNYSENWMNPVIGGQILYDVELDYG